MKFLQYSKPIFTALSPNTEKDDVLLALKLISQPKKWKQGKEIQELEEEFKKYLGLNFSSSFNSGRVALMAILEAMEIKKKDEVLLQAFTCNSAVNSILEREAKPIFVDIDDTLNIDPKDLERKITPRSRAIMVQHTFGWPAQMEEILRIVQKRQLFLIEDCAHSLGTKYKGKFCGTFGAASFFSFGRDKIISSVFGGMAATNNQKLAEKIKTFRKKLDHPSDFWIFQQLIHPILTNLLIMPTYGLNGTLGRILLGAFHQTKILSKAVSNQEKKGKFSKHFFRTLPNALAILAFNQFKKLEKFNKHRKRIAQFYQEQLENSNFFLPLARGNEENIEPIFMRYPVLTHLETDKILTEARKRKIFLNDGWRKKPVVPPDTKLNKMEYRSKSCRRAEKTAHSIINLPTHINISKKEAQKIVDFFNQIK